MEDERTRAFIAIELPDRLKAQLELELGRLRSSLGDGALRWVRPAAIHLTLRFLGDISHGMLEQVGSVLTPLCASCPPLQMEIGGLGRFPDGPRPRVVWIGVNERGGQLVPLQAKVENAIAGLGLRREDRPFHPHLTLARVRRGIPAPELRRLSDQLDQERVDRVGDLTAGQLALMRSVLGLGGASYHRLRQFELSGAL